MKYFESNVDFSSKSINNPVDLLRFVLASIFLSPIRLILEISRKCLFLGNYFNKFIMNAIYINVAFLILSLSSSFLVTKKFYIKGSFLPISSIVISIVLLLIVYYLGSRFSLDVDFELTDSIDDVVNNLEEVYGVNTDSVDSNTDSDNSNLSLVDKINKENIYSNGEELELVDEFDFDRMYDNVVKEELKNVPSEISNPLKDRLKTLKEDVKRGTNIHSDATIMLNEYQSVRDSEETKVDTIRKRYADVDEFSEMKPTDFIRRGKTTSEEKQVADMSFDDDPVNFMEDVNSYSNKILDRANRRRNSLDNILMSSSSSSMVEFEEMDSNLAAFNNVINGNDYDNDGEDDSYISDMEVYYNGDFGSGLINPENAPIVDLTS